MSFLLPRQEPPVSSRSELMDYFERAAKPAAEHRVGIELETLPARARDGGPTAVEDAVGTLERMARAGAYEADAEAGTVVHLSGHGRSVGLEPGGQVELSGAPHRLLDDAAREIDEHLSLLKTCTPPGIRWLALGAQPFARLDEIPWMPKARYRLLAEHLATRGDLGHHMMKKTATIQASFDFTSVGMAMEMLRTALLVTPVIVALSANSPYADGAATGYLSLRTAIWTRTDPARSGRFPLALREGFDLEAYVDHVLDLPLVLVREAEGWAPGGGMTFRELLARGWKGRAPTLFDWELHLSTFFPDARLKKVVEVRGADCPPPPLMIPLVAFMTGILYGDRGAVARLFQGVTPEAHGELQLEAARAGLCAPFRRGSLCDLAGELLDVAQEGLRSRAAAVGRDESPRLAPLRQLVEDGLSPAERLVRRYGERPVDVVGLIDASSV